MQEINEERGSRIQSLSLVEGDLKDMEDELTDHIEQEKLRSQEGDKELVIRIEDDLNRFRRELIEQTESREACESEIYELMKNVVVKIKDEIELEKKTRENTQENLLNLLEETCHKIEVMANSL